MPAFFRPLHESPTLQVEVYLAHSDRAGRPVPPATLARHLQAVERAVQQLPGGGGSSSYEVRGAWAGLPDGVRETTTVVRGSVAAWAVRSGDAALPLARALVEYGQATNQALVGLSLDGVWHEVDEAAALAPVLSVRHEGLAPEDRLALGSLRGAWVARRVADAGPPSVTQPGE